MVQSSELSFVVQGPVSIIEGVNVTGACLDSIRQHFPNSPIIFSTDIGASVEGLDFDILVESDTRAPRIIENDRVGNIMPANLQIITTVEGLKVVRTDYAVKIRSDMVVTNSNLLKILNKRPKRIHSQGLTLTEELVVVLNWSTIDPRKYLKIAHHPADQLYAGKTSDLLAIWDVPLYPIEFMRWYEKREYPKNARHGDSLVKYRCESWIWMNFIAKFQQIELDSSYEITDEILKESISLMVHNLEVISMRMAGVSSLKNPRPSLGSRVKMLTYLDWIILARKNHVHAKYSRIDFDSFTVSIARILIDRFNLMSFVFPKQK
jgi:hypothetical protein